MWIEPNRFPNVTPHVSEPVLPLLHHQFVSNSSNRLHSERRACQAVSQVGNMDVDSSGVSEVVVSPHNVEELVSFENEAQVPDECHEEIELFHAKLHCLAVDRNFALAFV